MIIHSVKHSTAELVCKYNDISTSEIAVIISGAEDHIIGTQDIFIRRYGELSANRSKRSDTIPVTYSAHNPLSHILIQLHGTHEWYLGLWLQCYSFSRCYIPHMTPSKMYA